MANIDLSGTILSVFHVLINWTFMEFYVIDYIIFLYFQDEKNKAWRGLIVVSVSPQVAKEESSLVLSSSRALDFNYSIQLLLVENRFLLKIKYNCKQIEKRTEMSMYHDIW